MPRQGVLAPLFQLYPKAGFLYVICHSGWGENVYKIGRTTDWPQRQRSYNSSQPDPIKLLQIYTCRNVHSIEMHLKHLLRAYTIGDHLEFVRITYWKLFKAVNECLELDEGLSLRMGTLVYRLFDHICALYSPTSLSGAMSARCVPLPRSQNESNSSSSLGGTWIYFEQKHEETSWKVQSSDIVQRSLRRQLTNVTPTKNVTERNIYFNSDRNGFVVDMIRHGKRYKKLFSVRSLGVELAKKIAIKFRDSLGERAPPSAQFKQSKRKGVYFNQLRNTWVGSIQYRRARKKKEFSVEKYGDRAAEQMAWEWRQSESFLGDSKT